MPRDYRTTHSYRTHEDEASDTSAPAARACPGFCNAGYRAAEKKYREDGVEHPLEPWEGQPVWCPPCMTKIRLALCDMPELAVRLQLEADSGLNASASENDEFVAGTRERALHEHQAVVFALEELAGWLALWDDSVRDWRGLAPRTPQRGEHKTAQHSSLFLRIHLSWILTEHDPDAAEAFGSELLSMHRKAQILTKSQEVLPDRCIGVACPYCDKRALEWEVDVLGVATGNVKCRKCRPILRMTATEYERWTKMLAADACVRGRAPLEKLREVFGGSIPTQFLKLANEAAAALGSAS